VHNSVGQPVFTSHLSTWTGELLALQPGAREFRVRVPAAFLAPDTYTVSIGMHRPNLEVLDYHEHALRFRIEETGSSLYAYAGHSGATYGNVLVRFAWEG
jgi:lipopolysaccharide transport system ATP-binding protein